MSWIKKKRFATSLFRREPSLGMMLLDNIIHHQTLFRCLIVVYNSSCPGCLRKPISTDEGFAFWTHIWVSFRRKRFELHFWFVRMVFMESLDRISWLLETFLWRRNNTVWDMSSWASPDRLSSNRAQIYKPKCRGIEPMQLR